MHWKKKNKTAYNLAIASGILLLLSGTTGVSSLETLGNIVFQFIDSAFLRLAFLILFIVASLGGVSVIIGGVLIKKNNPLLGRILIMVGSGAGIISLAIHLLFALFSGDLTLSWFTSFATIGVILSVIAQLLTYRKH